ncbi:P3 protein isoform X2 [Pristis pectinata]|uniref:P3 protein isoform X2 n=1 Tax=Pristis pectinata TaxID=685728 RepID=UPI00223D0DDB|nr:P3 protein isoform X2 [Pristis pectinata]
MVDVSKLWAAGMEKALLIVVIAGGVCCLPDSNQNLTTSERYYVNIGDGTSTQFDFPENTNGIIVVSSRYRAATEKGCTRLIVESLDPDVLKIINVTDAETIGLVKSYIVSIKSRLAGTAPLLIRLLDVARVKPLTVEERKDYIIKVSPSLSVFHLH